ncbi:hypothetical protein ACFQ1E_18215 [Sphingomonas canadensis]|uniref:Uncharacterized protein n=1 Tax=Sphingomonas canadensis TaxID=1219257 RepID=A0ABW3HC55_9SPHN|nr:hypothetical protein [Sphingomonas canadensis]MCW3837923.1 hypothetical protein [Sphingomonas canadensis]
MICVSVMLAIFLGWPLAFGGKSPGLDASIVDARPVAAAVAATRAKPPAPAPAHAAAPAPAAEPAAPVKPESCYKRYQREVKQCSGSSSAACRLKAADGWDLCEATGFWPE